eukprot:Pgem_evm1s14832
MAIGLKNAITLIEEISEHYEFAINEACVRYNECHRNEPWFAQNKAVFGCEYEGELSDVCATSSDYNTKTKLNLGEGWINCFEGDSQLCHQQERYKTKMVNRGNL